MNTATFSFPTTIRFGVGSLAELPGHLERLNVRQPLIVTDPGLLATGAFSALQKVMAGRGVVYSGVHPNPIEVDFEEATQAYADGQCDGVVGFGGGSALDVAKAVRLRVHRPEMGLGEFDFGADWKGLAPFIAIPTTAGTGSEVGRSSVIMIGGRKRVIFHPELLAALVLLDPVLTLELPAKLTAATGADALTHCIEALTSTVFHPLCNGIALEGIALAGQSLAQAVENGNDLEARGRMQIAAMMGGIAFQKDLGAVHSLAHPLSSICGLHHGLANALCLPHVMEFNAAHQPGLYRRVGIALGLSPADDAQTIDAVRTLLARIGLKEGLRAHGVTDAHLDPLAEQAWEDSCHRTNPVSVTKADLRTLYALSL